jgi:hypothetical protein
MPEALARLLAHRPHHPTREKRVDLGLQAFTEREPQAQAFTGSAGGRA